MAGIKDRVTAAREQEDSVKAEAEGADAEAEKGVEDDKDMDEEAKPKAKPKGKAKSKAADKAQDDDEDKEDMAAKARADAAEVSRLCTEAGVPALASVLIAEGLSATQAKARIEGAAEIRGLVARARRVNPSIDGKLADDLIAAGASAEHARAQLFDRIVSMQSADIRNTHTPGSRPAGEASDHGWGAAIAKVFGRKEG